MREYIISFNGSWIHFFIKPHIGLCSRQKNGLKFDSNEILVPSATSDFCVYTYNGFIHLVCQDEKGSVLYLVYDGASWRKHLLLESKTAKPYNKNFVMLEISGHINLLYTIDNKGSLNLVHQVLTNLGAPEIVCAIADSAVPFTVLKHHETDFSVYYTSTDNTQYEIIYRWSQKRFTNPRQLENDYKIRFAFDSSSDLLFAATKKTDKTNNLFCIRKASDNIPVEMPVYYDCSNDIVPVISRYADKFYAVWTEHGNVMSSCLSQDGKWSKPMLYAKSSKSETKLYLICSDGKYEYYYGVAREHDITLYGTHDILKKPPACHKPVRQAEPSEQSAYNSSMNEKRIKMLYHELIEQRKKIIELSEKIDNLISDVPIADDDDIDRILLR